MSCWHIFINFIKICGLSPAPHKINATSKQHLSRQVLQVSRRVIIRKEILNTLKSVLKCCGGSEYFRIVFRMTVRVNPKYYMVAASYWMCKITQKASYNILRGFTIWHWPCVFAKSVFKKSLNFFWKFSFNAQIC